MPCISQKRNFHVKITIHIQYTHIDSICQLISTDNLTWWESSCKNNRLRTWIFLIFLAVINKILPVGTLGYCTCMYTVSVQPFWLMITKAQPVDAIFCLPALLILKLWICLVFISQHFCHTLIFLYFSEKWKLFCCWLFLYWFHTICLCFFIILTWSFIF